MIVYILQTINEAVVYEPIKCIRTLTRNRFYLPPYAMEENITRLDIHLYAVKIYSTDIYRVRKIFTKIFWFSGIKKQVNEYFENDNFYPLLLL